MEIIIASAESLIGSVWGCVASLSLGYIMGHALPLSTLASWLPKKRD